MAILVGSACLVMLEPPESVDLPPAISGNVLLTCAGADQQVVRSLAATLDAQCSRQLMLSSPSTLWRQISGTRVTLLSAVTAVTRYAAPLSPGALDFVVEQQTRDSSGSDQVRIEVVERDAGWAPLAIGAGDLVLPADRIVLDASASLALQGVVAGYRWRQVAGAPAIIADPTSAVTEVEIGSPAGIAVFAVEIHDSQQLWSEPEFVVVHPAAAGEVPPAPVVTAPRVVDPGASVTIETPPRTTEDDRRVAFRQLRGDAVALDLSDRQRVRFVAPRVPQLLVFRCDVEEAGVRAPPAVVQVRVSAGIGNRAPIAEAGPDRRVRPEQTVVVDGAGSRDPDGSRQLDFRWSQTAGAQVELACAAAQCLFRTPSGAGAIALSLVVSDGTAESTPDVVVLTVDPGASNLPPIANAGGERWALPGAAIVLDGSRSDDPDSGAIASYHWRQLDDGAPPAQLGPLDGPQLELVAPAQTAELRFELTVCDTDQACASDTALLHVQPGGAYVDAVLGSDEGDGTAAAPLRTVEQGLDRALRFGLSAVQIAAGDYLLAGPLRVPPLLTLQGGLIRDGDSYRFESSAVTRLLVSAEPDGVTLETGAGLAQLTIEPAPASATLPERRSIVLGSHTRCREVVAIGPSHSDVGVAIEVVDGATASIDASDVRGGGADSTSYAVLAGGESAVEIVGTRIGVGAGGQRSVGIANVDGSISVSACTLHLIAELAPAAAGAVVGLEQRGGELRVADSSIALDAVAAAATVDSAVALSCDGCRLQVASDSAIHGPRELTAGALGIGCLLQGAVSAVVDGVIAGGASSPQATLLALAARNGSIDLQVGHLTAASDGAAATGYGLHADRISGRIAVSSVEAIAHANAAGVVLAGSADLDLSLGRASAVAAQATGIVDGRDPVTGDPLPPSSNLVLTVAAGVEAVGSARATGVGLYATSSPQVVLSGVRATAVDASAGLLLADSNGALLAADWIEAIADRSLGTAVSLQCQTTTATTRLAIARTRLSADAADATACDATGCSVELTSSVAAADGALAARGLVATNEIILNGALVSVRGNAHSALALGRDATAQLVNSAIELSPGSGIALRAADTADQFIALHHLLFAPIGSPLLEVGGVLAAADAVELMALRPRFTDIDQVAALLIDDSGHIVDPDSPAIDAADPTTAAPDDIDGDPRPAGDGPDIGPDEYH
ncbi:MAG: hypothetical protein JXR83_00250 [Deltaproteobacteria bacterium]|nr:hypothetical protein [Deltaproteobacteria bacterium]